MSTKEEYREAAETLAREDAYERESKLRETIAKLYQSGTWLRSCLSASGAKDSKQSQEFCKAIDSWDDAVKDISKV